MKDNIIPHFILTELPPGLLGLLLAGLLAAAMSSMDSDLNSVAAVVVQNFYRRMRPGAAQRRQLMVGRAGVVVGGLLSIFLAQQWIGIESLVKYSLGLGLVVSGENWACSPWDGSSPRPRPRGRTPALPPA